MIDVQQGLLSLFGLTFLLGLRHGLDPDHLAAIDNLTRYNAERAPALARWCGALFSLGHGAAVTAVAVTLAALSASDALPAWLDGAGQIIAIGFLLAIGLANLRASLGAAPAPVGTLGWLAPRLLRRATSISHPMLISLIGVAFAVSMDTMSQAALFSVAAQGKFAWTVAGLLGLTFTAGMLATDTASGWWVSRMLRSGRARSTSRALTLAIALLSLAVAASSIARMFWHELDHWYDGHTLEIGVATLLLLAAVYLAGARAQRA
jgi:high-affinity nickel-transport protein